MVQVNNYTGGETQGADELISEGGSVTFTGDVRSGGGCYALATSNTSSIQVPWFADGIADAGNDYIIGFGYRINDDKVPTSALEILQVLDDSSAVILDLQLDGSSNILIRNAASSTIRTITDPMTLGVYRYFELYFQHDAAGTIELFIDGISQGEDTSQDLTDGNTFGTGTSSTETRVIFLNHPSIGDVIFDDIYILSGATAASDRLGGSRIDEMPEVFGYQNDIAASEVSPDIAAITGASDLNDAGWGDAAETPGSDSNVCAYTDTMARSGCAYTDFGKNPGPAAVLGDTYYFDASDVSASDPDSVWNNDSNAFDGSTSTNSNTTSTNAGSPTVEELAGEGTNAPASGGTINAVIFRVFGSASSSNLSCEVASDGRADILFNGLITSFSTAKFQKWENLDVPSGGWTWAKIQALEIRFYDSSTLGNNVAVYRAEIFVQHSTGSTQFNPTIDGDANIRAWKGVWRGDRAGGGASTWTIYMGNDADSIGGFDNDTVTLLNGTINNFELLGETDPPLSTENFAQGIGKNGGGRDWRLYEMWAMLLHVPSKISEPLSNLSDGIMGTQNSFEGPFEI